MVPEPGHPGIAAAVQRMRDDGASAPAIAAFERRAAQLLGGDDGLLPGDALEPVGDPPALDTLPGVDDPGLLRRVAVVKLNGGLGTSMGLHHAKSLVAVKGRRTFLDVIAAQVLALRLPLVLMSSFATADDTERALARHEGLDAEQFPQSREPKLDAETFAPAEWPADPRLEWCPPGHGDLYAALAGSGMLRRLRERGIDWAFTSNADNLGAVLEPRIPAWAERNDTPFVMEVVRGTAADRKGGHIALRDGRLVLRETAQVPDGDESFGDVERWRFYNTNNLWIDLRALERLMADDPAGPALPLIVNHKTVDPGDDTSPPVLQLETAMGAAVGAIDGARALHVPRARFAPVKTTDDLLVVRSDAYELGAGGRLTPAFDGDPPVVALDPDHYRRLADFDERFAHGPPSLRRARSLRVRGDVRFGPDVTVVGDVRLEGPRRVPGGTTLSSAAA
jgi:UTP--glucose-1-phosphate uridylyltransferase